MADALFYEDYLLWDLLRTYGRTTRTRVSDIAHQVITGQLRPEAVLHSAIAEASPSAPH